MAFDGRYRTVYRWWCRTVTAKRLRYAVIVSVILFLCSGCMAARPRTEIPETEAVQAAYRAGMEAALRGYQEQTLDNDFPYRNWSPPLVQRLWVPPRIAGGVFIPGHMDEVIVKPGAWKREFSAPLSSHQSLSNTRPNTHDRAVGASDRWPADGDTDASVPPPSRVPPAPHVHPPLHPGTASGWAELPPPGRQWRQKQ
jgi:hypothetical protein